MLPLHSKVNGITNRALKNTWLKKQPEVPLWFKESGEEIS